MKTVIISLHERWWRKMVAGEKVLEIRKTKPADWMKGNFRVLAYITGGQGVCGEFICNRFLKIRTIPEVQSRAGVMQIDVQGKSCLSKEQLKQYAGSSGKPLWGWTVSQVKEYCTPHPIELYGLKRPPQSWCYYKGDPVPDIMTINELANVCGYFYNAEFDPEAPCTPNNGYNCRHPQQEEEEDGVGCCFQWSCPLENIIPADEEDCKKYGIEYEDGEFVLVYEKSQKGGEEKA